MPVSPQLLYFCERLSGFSTNYFKLEPNTSTSATAGQILAFDLPANSILNLPSFSVHFNAHANHGAAGVGARLPPVKDLFERIEVSMGGVILSQGNNYANVLSEAKAALTGYTPDTALGHPHTVQSEYYNSHEPALADGANEENVPASGETLFSVKAKEMEGFMSTAEPRLFDTSIVPDIRVRLYLATDSVLMTSTTVIPGTAKFSFHDCSKISDVVTAGPPQPEVEKTGAKYIIKDLYATIECISLADMTYENVLSSTMASQGYLEVPFKAYHTFVDTHSGTSRFSVASQSIDRVWLAWRDAMYNKQATPVLVQKTSLPVHCRPESMSVKQISSTTEPATTVTGATVTPAYGSRVAKARPVKLDTVSKSRYFNFIEPALHPTDLVPASDPADAGKESYTEKHQAFGTSTINWRAQLQLNGAYLPQYSASVEDLYNISMNSLPGRDKRSQTLATYKLNNCVQCFRLNMPDSEFSRTLSGLDTRAVNLAGYVRTENTLSNQNLSIFVECTSTLRIGAGRAIELIS